MLSERGGGGGTRRDGWRCGEQQQTRRAPQAPSGRGRLAPHRHPRASGSAATPGAAPRQLRQHRTADRAERPFRGALQARRAASKSHARVLHEKRRMAGVDEALLTALSSRGCSAQCRRSSMGCAQRATPDAGGGSSAVAHGQQRAALGTRQHEQGVITSHLGLERAHRSSKQRPPLPLAPCAIVNQRYPLTSHFSYPIDEW